MNALSKSLITPTFLITLIQRDDGKKQTLEKATSLPRI